MPRASPAGLRGCWSRFLDIMRRHTMHFHLNRSCPLILVPPKMGRRPEHKDANVFKCRRRTSTRVPTTSSLTGSIESHSCKSEATQRQVTVRKSALTDHEITRRSQGYTRQPRSHHQEANEEEDLTSETLSTNPISSH